MQPATTTDNGSTFALLIEAAAVQVHPVTAAMHRNRSCWLRMTHSSVSTVRPQPQEPETVLQKLLVSMFPEGEGAPKLMAKIDKVAAKLNGLLVDAKAAVVAFWKARGYDPKKLEITKQKLGYALDQEEALGYLVVRAMDMAPLQPATF